MEKITELLDKLENLGDLLPKLNTLTGWVQWLISLAVRIGPICILVLGLIYLLIPPKEANRKAGYRTIFGMGSITAWHFTQRVAGTLMTVIGAILTVSAYVTVTKIANLDLMDMAYKAFQTVKVQAVCALIIYVFMFVLTALVFDYRGFCRFPKIMDTKLGKLLFIDEPMFPCEEEEEEYEEEPAEETL